MSSGGSILLRGGLVVDGTGAPPQRADVLVVDDRIAAIGVELGAADRTIQCDGMVVAPGFIDLHTHSDLTLLRYPAAMTRLHQGVTTEVTGNCGMSSFPVTGDPAELRGIIGPLDVAPEVEIDWAGAEGYLTRLRRAQPAVNIVPLVGHGSLRQWANGARVDLAEGAAARMGEQLERLLASGMWGMSLGLMYAPGESAGAAELDALARIVERHDGILSAHMRSYDAAKIEAALDEVLSVGVRTGARVQISHLRTIGDHDAAAMRRALAHLDAVPSAGADAYPYLAGHTTLLQLLAPETRSRGTEAVLALLRSDPQDAAAQIRRNGIGAEMITIAKCADDALVGSTLAELAATRGEDWGMVAVELLVEADGAVDIIAVGSEWTDTIASLSHPAVSIASDGVSLDLDHDANLPHPRSAGTFPVALALLLRAGMPIEQIVHKCTGLPARRVGLTDRGIIAPGHAADIVVFAPEELSTETDYLRPLTVPPGIAHVIVNGTLALSDATLTHGRAGRVLLRSAS